MAHTLDPKEPTVWLRACEMETRLAQLRDDVDRLCGDIAGTGRYEAVGEASKRRGVPVRARTVSIFAAGLAD